MAHIRGFVAVPGSIQSPGGQLSRQAIGATSSNSRPEKDILNYAMYHNGSAQARGFKTASIPNESDFYSEDFPLDTPRS